ncbi:MAG: hypothetical protein WDA16_10105 [Candidatus Thermoplasmatota archaeon]
MPDETPILPVTPDVAERIVKDIVRALGPGWAIMPLGGTAMGRLSARPAATKDIDLVVVLVSEAGAKIPDFDALVKIAHQLAKDKSTIRPRSDHTSVELAYSTTAGPVKLELIRGRGAQGGYFVTRRVLEAAISQSTLRDGVFEMPPEALAFLKAWGAHDKMKLVAAGKDERGYHADRERGFRRDVETIRRDMLDRGQVPRASVQRAMLDACGPDRQKAIGRILREAGWAT